MIFRMMRIWTPRALWSHRRQGVHTYASECLDGAHRDDAAAIRRVSSRTRCPSDVLRRPCVAVLALPMRRDTTRRTSDNTRRVTADADAVSSPESLHGG